MPMLQPHDTDHKALLAYYLWMDADSLSINLCELLMPSSLYIIAETAEHKRNGTGITGKNTTLHHAVSV